MASTKKLEAQREAVRQYLQSQLVEPTETNPVPSRMYSVECTNRDYLKDLYDRGILTRTSYGVGYTYNVPKRRDGFFGQAFMSFCLEVGLIELAEKVQTRERNWFLEGQKRQIQRDIDAEMRRHEEIMKDLQARLEAIQSKME